MKKRLIIVVSLLVGILILVLSVNLGASEPGSEKPASSSNQVTANIPQKRARVKDKPAGDSKQPETPGHPGDRTPKPRYYQNVLVVNKKNPVPASFSPGEDPAAGRAIKRLISGMQAAGLSVAPQYSGYRPYAFQKKLYDDYVKTQGKEYADNYSARPGYSEHQTGLAFDLRSPNGLLLQTPKEVSWVRDNAWKYGFILRFPADKVSQTGYRYEAWHLRYVGSPQLARDIKASGLCLEEYVGAPGGGYD